MDSKSNSIVFPIPCQCYTHFPVAMLTGEDLNQKGISFPAARAHDDSPVRTQHLFSSLEMIFVTIAQVRIYSMRNIHTLILIPFHWSISFSMNKTQASSESVPNTA